MSDADREEFLRQFVGDVYGEPDPEQTQDPAEEPEEEHANEADAFLEALFGPKRDEAEWLRRLHGGGDQA